MHKIAVVGDIDSILAFKAVGLEVYPVNNDVESKKIIDRLAISNFAIIFITENIAQGILDTIERYSKRTLPAIILIPNNKGSLNIASKIISDNVEKAVGVNIL